MGFNSVFKGLKIILYVPAMQFCWFSSLPRYCYVYWKQL